MTSPTGSAARYAEARCRSNASRGVVKPNRCYFEAEQVTVALSWYETQGFAGSLERSRPFVA